MLKESKYMWGIVKNSNLQADVYGLDYDKRSNRSLNFSYRMWYLWFWTWKQIEAQR